MRVRIARLAKARWRGLRRACRQYVARRPGLTLVASLVVLGGGLYLATLPGHRDEKGLVAAPALRPSTQLSAPSEPVTVPEKSVEPRKPVEEAALRPPPLL